jgi:hypothetical protein
MSNVVGLGGAPVVLPGEPDENIVDLLEGLLADAKSGKIVALGVASVDQNGWCLASYALNTHRYTLAGAISSLQYTLQRDIEDSHND